MTFFLGMLSLLFPLTVLEIERRSWRREARRQGLLFEECLEEKIRLRSKLDEIETILKGDK